MTGWREVLRIALHAYLLALRERWQSHDGEIERVVAAVGATATPTAAEREHVERLLADAERAFGLTPGEEALAAAAWWADADPQFAVVLGCAHDDSTRRHASAGLIHLALAPFGIAVPPTVNDDDPLVHRGVLEPGAGTSGPLRLTPTARAVLAGLPPRPLAAREPLPERLAPLAAALARHFAAAAPARDVAVAAAGSEPAGMDGAGERAGGVGAAGERGGVAAARSVPAGEAAAAPAPVVLRGPGGLAVAIAAADALGLTAVGGDRPIPELRLLARAGLALPVVGVEVLAGWGDDGPLVVLAGVGEMVAGGHVVDVPGPSFAERERAWAVHAPELAGALASRFAFTEAEVAEVIARADRDARWRGGERDVWDAARRQPQHALHKLAQLVAPGFTLEDLVLEAQARAQLEELVAHVRLQHVVLDGWGFRRRMPRGQGVAVLFAGPSGTGKTTAAEAVAHALGHDLYRVDLSAVVSKYIGETEKNLALAFDEAERAGAVLLFDEADALFGKRTEVRDAHDRYANLEVNYLLQRVETFTGLVILATNRQSALDEAFVRRLRFVVRFELPDRANRHELWLRSFPADTKLAPLDYHALAGAELSGGSIQGVALAAAYLAAADGGTVVPAHVEHALKREFEKLGRAVPTELRA